MFSPALKNKSHELLFSIALRPMPKTDNVTSIHNMRRTPVYVWCNDPFFPPGSEKLDNTPIKFIFIAAKPT